MIARGAQGNPWIFSEMIEHERTGKIPSRPTNEEIRKMMLRHAKLQLQYKGEYLGIREMRKHVAWYTKGLPGSAKLREEINGLSLMQNWKICCTDSYRCRDQKPNAKARKPNTKPNTKAEYESRICLTSAGGLGIILKLRNRLK